MCINMIEFFLLVVLSPIVSTTTLFHAEFSRVSNLQIIDFQKTLSIDAFPVYFKLKFEILKHSYSILFKRRLKFYPVLNSTSNELYFKSYKSISIDLDNSQQETFKYTAKAMLYLTYEAYSIMKANDSGTLQNWIHSVYHNLSQVYLTDVTLRRHSQELLTNGQHELTRLIYNHTGGYIAYRTTHDSVLLRNKTSTKTTKRENTQRVELTVECCVFIHNRVYQNIRSFLKTNDHDYVRLFFSIRFTEVILNVDKIYKTISDEFFSMNVVFKDLFIQVEPDARFNQLADRFVFITFVQDYMNELFTFNKYPNLNPNNCDHIFFMHDYIFGPVLGQAYVNKVCLPELLTSANLYLTEMETVLGHELGHNIGAEHDPHKGNCKSDVNLMFAAATGAKSHYTISECTIKQFQENLFFPDRTIKPSFLCLTQSNRQPKDYLDELVLNTPYLAGTHFSFSDQCRLSMEDEHSYSCNTGSPDDQCSRLYCYAKKTQECRSEDIPLDGTACGKDSLCLFRKCVTLNYTKIEHKVWSLRKEPVTGELERAGRNLKNLCPSGPDQEAHAVFQPLRDISELDRRKSCASVFFSTKSPVCQKNDNFVNVCCEKCLGFRLNRCSWKELENGKCRLKTCEDFKQNPCYNGARCVSDASLLFSKEHVVAFKCICKKGYKG
jgi:hypothetical protein